MKLEDIFLAKFADLTPDGLFTVVGGGLNRIQAESFPWSWGFMYLLAQIRLTIEEAQRPHLMAVEREIPNGLLEEIAGEAPVSGLDASAQPGPDGLLGINFCFCLVSLIFPEEGVYKYRLKIDGLEVGVAELLVKGPILGEMQQ
jgi:hypothetical protein